MPIYGTCVTCGGETRNYACLACMIDSRARLHQALIEIVNYPDQSCPALFEIAQAALDHEEKIAQEHADKANKLYEEKRP